MGLKNKKGQTWSFDLIVAVVLFIIVIALFYTFLTKDQTDNSKVTSLESSSALITSNLNCNLNSNSNECIIKKNKLDETKVNELASKTYNQIKKDFGIQGDFCIYLLSKDGTYIPLGDKIGIGTDLLLVNGSGITLYCGDTVN